MKHVMKRSHMIAIGIAVIAILLAVMLIPQDTAPPPPPHPMALLIDGQPVSPFCFISRTEDDMTNAYPLNNCDDNGDLVADPAGGNPEFHSNFSGAVYQSRSYDFLRGLVGYRYLGDVDGHKALWIVENSGGSGFFSSLVMVSHDREANHLQVQDSLAFGDRCNGGIVTAAVVDGSLTYERDMTPFDMMGLAGDDSDSGQRSALQTARAAQLPACAACCYGKARFVHKDFIGVEFDERLAAALRGKSYRDKDTAEHCFDRLVIDKLSGGEIYFDSGAFTTFAATVRDNCLISTE